MMRIGSKRTKRRSRRNAPRTRRRNEAGQGGNDNRGATEHDNDSSSEDSYSDILDSMIPDISSPANDQFTNIYEALKCGICHEIMRDPTKITGCPDGHSFCRECLTRACRHVSSQKCPTCRKTGTGIEVIVALRELLSNSNEILPCFNKITSRQGEENEVTCEWTGNIREYLVHKRECVNEFVKCPCCDEQMYRDELGVIDEFSREFPGFANDCDTISRMAFFEAGEVRDILSNENTTTGMTGHYSTCQKLKIWCMYKECGCRCTFPREDKNNHYRTTIHHHNSLLCNIISDQRRRISELETEMKRTSGGWETFKTRIQAKVTRVLELVDDTLIHEYKYSFGKIRFTITVAERQMTVRLDMGISSGRNNEGARVVQKFRHFFVEVTVNKIVRGTGKSLKNDIRSPGHDGYLVTVPINRPDEKRANKRTIGDIECDEGEYVWFDITFEVAKNNHTVMFD